MHETESNMRLARIYSGLKHDRDAYLIDWYGPLALAFLPAVNAYIGWNTRKRREYRYR